MDEWFGVGGRLGQMMDLVVDRTEEAALVSRAILAADAAFVVLHGPADTGKTELMKRWVVPALEASGGREVWYGDCAPHFPKLVEGRGATARVDELVTKDCLIIVDSFGRVLDLPREARESALKGVFARFRSQDAKAALVMVVGSEELTALFGLASMAPDIMSCVFELGSIDVSEGLRRLSSIAADTAVSYSPEVVQALTEDLATHGRQGRGVNFDLLKVLDFQFRRLAATSGDPLRVYEGLGGLNGILRDYLEYRMHGLGEEEPGDEELASAILQEVVETARDGRATVLADMAPRLDVSGSRLQRVIDHLSGPGGLLSDAAQGRYALVPSHLAAVVEEDAASRRPENERVRRIVAEGMRGWQQLGHLLPVERFAEVHQRRRQLLLEDQEIQFLLRCALLHEEAESVTACDYWLRRIEAPQDGMGILLFSLLDDHSGVRGRAARLLGAFPDAEVRSRLHHLALGDSDPAVRRQAVSSLESMRTDELMQDLIQTIQDPESVYRTAGVEALGIFKNDEAARVLQQIVNDPTAESSLRSAAIRVLGRQNTTESVDALTAIALHDEDQEDREEAAKALASTESTELNRYLLERLRPPEGSPVPRAAAVLAGATVLGIVGLVGLTVLTVSLGYVVALVALVAATWVTRRFLIACQNGSMKLRSWRGFVGVLSFAVCASTVFLALHGLAHLFIKQRAKAFAIFGAELLGLGIFVFTVRGAFSGFLGPVGGVLQNTYLTVGLLLFGGTYLYDVSVVLFGTIVFGERVRAKERRAAIYPRVLGNRVAAQVAFAGLQSGRAGEARRVRKVFTRFGDSIDPQQLIHLLEAADKSVEPVVTRSLVRARDDEAVRELVARWGSADESLRRKIFRVLCRRPTQRSVDGLRQLRGHLGPLRKVRAWVSYAYLPLRAVPRPVVLGILLVAPVATAFLYDGFMTYQNPARPLVNFLRTPLRPFGRSDEVLRRARTVEFLGSAFRDEVADELRGLLEGGGYSDYPTVQAELVEALALQYSQNPSLEPSPELTDLLVEHAGILSDVLTGGGEPEQFQAALDALATLATVGDSVLAEQAIQGLLSYLAAETPCCEGKQATDAINALSNLPRERALTALRLAPIDLRDELGKFFADEVLVSILTTDGRSLSIGDSATGSLDSNAARGPDDRRGQAWGLEGRSGDEVAIVMESEDFDPYLYLAGPGLAEVQRDDDSAGDLDARIQLTLPEDGRYTIVAAAYRGGSGGYALRVERLEGLTLPADGRRIEVGQTLPGRLTDDDTAVVEERRGQVWSFEGRGGERLTIVMESGDFDPYLYLSGPGLEAVLWDDDSAGNRNARIELTLPEDGSYTIFATAYSDGSGNYVLRVEGLADPATLPVDGRTIALGETRSGRLTDADVAVIEGRRGQAWAFEGEAGQGVTIDLRSEEFDAYLYLVGPGLVEPMWDDDGGEDYDSRISLTLPQSGTYSIIVSAYSDPTGSFTVSVSPQ